MSHAWAKQTSQRSSEKKRRRMVGEGEKMVGGRKRTRRRERKETMYRMLARREKKPLLNLDVALLCCSLQTCMLMPCQLDSSSDKDMAHSNERQS